ncbi:hypothetical protein GCM10011371_33310 [Novosphingobium marinum]|nr:hypothetical protein GCM10011371_33310 [Novosphingobium marinum]
MAPVTASAASLGYNLRLTIPLHCTVWFDGAAGGAPAAGAVSLGRVTEFCNSPGGYQLILTYSPGTLVGTTILVGEDEVQLDGSGYAVVSRQQGPRKRERTIAAVLGADGFDTDRLNLQIVPV